MRIFNQGNSQHCVSVVLLKREGRGKKSVDFALPAKHLAHMTGHDLSVQTHALINQDNRGCQAVMFDIYSTRLVSWIWPILLSNEVSGPEHTIIPGNGFFLFFFFLFSPFWIAVLDEIFWGYFLVFMPKFLQLSNNGIWFCAWGFSDIQAGDIMQRMVSWPNVIKQTSWELMDF